MFNRKTGASNIACAALVAGLLLAGWAGEGSAQGWIGGGGTGLTRPMLATSVTNQGTQGGFIGTPGSRNNSLMYPSTAGGDPITGQAWANQLPFFRVDCNSEGRLLNNSQGEGIGLALRVPESFPVYNTHAQAGHYAVMTGPRSDFFDEIIPMLFDPSQDPELQYLGGEPRVQPSSGPSPGADWRSGVPFYYPSRWNETLSLYLAQDRYARAPVKIMNWQYGEYQTPGLPSAPSSRSAQWPEEIVVSKWTTLAGITFTRRNMAWSFPAWDDFFIVELEFENTGDSNGDGIRNLPAVTLEDVYVSFINNFMISNSEMCHYNRSDQWFQLDDYALDNWIAYSENPGYTGPARGLKMLVGWDGNQPLWPWNNTGGPVNKSVESTNCNTGRLDGEFTAFQYLGFGPLAYRDGGQWGYNSRDFGRYVQPPGEQPQGVHFWRISSRTVSDDPRPAAHSRRAIYDMMTKNGSDPNPDRVGAWFSSQSYGPYTLAPGEKGKIVVAWAAGSGAGEGDLYTWTRNNTWNYAALPAGQQWLVEFFNRAKWAYDNEYDVPKSPPDVYASVTNSPDARNLITWNSADDARNPHYTGADAQDVAGYRIYRAEWSPDGPWTKIGEVPRGTHSFEDEKSVPGFNYWYSVRTFARGHQDWQGRVGSMATLPTLVRAQVQAGLESGQWAQTQRVPTFHSPKQPAVAETERLDRDPFVVPNPFRMNDPNLQYPGRVQIRFVNVPSQCYIYIYSSSGDMLGKLLHDDRTDAPDNPDAWLGEAEWDQLAMSLGTGFIPAGVYFFVVESLVPESIGEKRAGNS